MKSKFIYTFFILGLVAFVFSANTNGRASNGWGNTGAPGDEVSGGNPRTCVTCHTGGSANGIQVTQSFELMDDDGNNVFDSGYTPGETYNAKLTVNTVTGNPAQFGFQVLCLNAAAGTDGPEVSDWTAVSSNVSIRTAVNTGRTYAEHTTASNSNVFEMTWVAPAANSGTVTFYASSNGVNDNGGTTGDGATIGTFELTENTSTSTKDLSNSVTAILFPNPVDREFSVKLNTQESGNYDWTILDTQGRTLQQGEFDLPVGESLQTINIADVAAGLYQLRLHKDGKIMTKTLVKK